MHSTTQVSKISLFNHLRKWTKSLWSIAALALVPKNELVEIRLYRVSKTRGKRNIRGRCDFLTLKYDYWIWQYKEMGILSSINTRLRGIFFRVKNQLIVFWTLCIVQAKSSWWLQKFLRGTFSSASGYRDQCYYCM